MYAELKILKKCEYANMLLKDFPIDYCRRRFLFLISLKISKKKNQLTYVVFVAVV